MQDSENRFAGQDETKREFDDQPEPSRRRKRRSSRSERDSEKIDPKAFAVTVIALFAISVLVWFILRHFRVLHIVNGLGHPVTLVIDGGSPRTIAALTHQTMYVSVGDHTIQTTLQNGQEMNDEIKITESFFSTFNYSRVHVYSPGGGAVTILEKIFYSTIESERKPSYIQYYYGKPYIEFHDISYAFEDAPETINIDSSAPKTTYKRRVGFVRPKYSAMLNPPLKAPYTKENALRYMQAHLLDDPTNMEFLNRYIDFGERLKKSKEVMKFLESGLSARPVRIEWNVFYSNLITQKTGGNETERKRLTECCNKEPDNVDLKYLLSRVQNHRESLQTLRDILRKDPNHQWAKSALCERMADVGNWQACWDATDLPKDLSNISSFTIQAKSEAACALNREKEMIPIVNKFLEENPYFENAYLWKANLLLSLNPNSSLNDIVDDFCKVNKSEKSQYWLKMTLLEMMGKMPDRMKVEDENIYQYFAINSIIQNGRFSGENEKIPLNQIRPMQALCILVGCLKRGDIKRAEKWKTRTLKILETFEDPVARQLEEFLTMKPNDYPSPQEINEKTDIPKSFRAVLFLYAAYLNPTLKTQYLDIAERLNVQREFPYYFVSKTIRELRMKK